MPDLAAVIRHFPRHELTIRRLYLRMPEFRSLCEDYVAARCALERWRADEGKSRDFQQLIEEIETEIEEFIQGSLMVLRQRHQEKGI
ncbi:hypothetical protein OE766_15380 [Pararhizobium sp. YC-54]|uniref:hypothetical protein n=1 Tax=Pararhizobium sp. YC-54 TaxID=2986920 RepID=UPI0021F71F36|nr:hypothetical protein [Pararhizobium sp. YC-54]MCV9999624.1 hypothetical protein [Pararhizobium sp. YC-54]